MRVNRVLSFILPPFIREILLARQTGYIGLFCFFGKMEKYYIKKRLDELIPYANNPRRNDNAVEAVAESINQVGYITPIVIDENNEILAGHTRVKAMQHNGVTEDIEVLQVLGLTEDQKKAYRLLDNKTSELAEWDLDKLDQELDEILDIDMSKFGFDIYGDVESEGYYGDERERTYDAYNLSEFNVSECEGFYQMPVLKPCDYVPDDIRSFNYMLSAKEKDFGIHFYCDDYQFERIWNRPEFYIDKLKEFQCAFTPDFSLYMSMPMAMKIWNVYRSRLIGQMMQREGLFVIPTVSWAEPETFEFCFDGLPHNATLSVSTIGVKKDSEALKIWRAGMDEMIKRLTPKTLLIYGGVLDYDYGDIEVIYYDNATVDRMAGKE